MKCISNKLSIALLAFSLGIACTFVWFSIKQQFFSPVAAPYQPNSENRKSEPHLDTNSLLSEQIIYVDFCDLVSNPEKYHGRLVRVSALYQEGLHGTILGDSSCVRIETQTAVLFHPLQSKEIEKVIADASGKSEWGGRASRVRIVGRLQKVTPTNNSDLLIDTAPLHFEVLFIEEALSLDSRLK